MSQKWHLGHVMAITNFFSHVFGLINAPTTFMDLINCIFCPLLGKCMIIFIDHILLYSPSQEQHEENLRIVLRTLREHRLYAKFSTYEVWLDKITFSGHVVLGENFNRLREN